MGKRPVRSVARRSVNSIMLRWVVFVLVEGCRGVLGSTRCGKISGWDSTGRVDLTFLRASFECPFAVAKLVGRCFEISSAVKPGHEEK